MQDCQSISAPTRHSLGKMGGKWGGLQRGGLGKGTRGRVWKGPLFLTLVLGCCEMILQPCSLFWEWLLHSVEFISTVQQSESAISIHICPLFWIIFPFRLPQSTEFPVQYNRSSSVIYFRDRVNSVYIEVNSSLPINPVPPFPSLVSMPLLSSSVSLFLLCK